MKVKKIWKRDSPPLWLLQIVDARERGGQFYDPGGNLTKLCTMNVKK